MPPSLEPAGFPHIVEQILGLVDYGTLVRARGVNKAMCAIAEDLLTARRSSELELTLRLNRHGDVVTEGPKGPLPFSHPGSPRGPVEAAMRRATKVAITESVGFSLQTQALLQHLQPKCRVRIHHNHSIDQGFCLPRIRSLMIVVPTCCSQCVTVWVSPWQNRPLRITVIPLDEYPTTTPSQLMVGNRHSRDVFMRGSDINSLCSTTEIARRWWPKVPSKAVLECLRLPQKQIWLVVRPA